MSDPNPDRRPPVTVLLCVNGDDPHDLLARLICLATWPGHDGELLAVGYGDPESAATVLRAAVARIPYLRVVLHPRRVGRAEAIAAGVGHARTDWIALPGEGVLDPWLGLIADPDPRCAYLGVGKGLQFARDAYLALPRIVRMDRFLPELFARQGLRLVDTSDARNQGTPPFRPLRRACVALLCTMAGNAAPTVSRAMP